MFETNDTKLNQKIKDQKFIQDCTEIVIVNKNYKLQNHLRMKKWILY